jgi:hypothetical protein
MTLNAVMMLSLSFVCTRDLDMGIVYPSKNVALRWEGALKARLRRVPLEKFLRARALTPAPAGISQDSDNLVRAAVLILEEGLERHFAQPDPQFALHQQASAALAACVVSVALAQEFSKPETWRTVALMSAAQSLSPFVGLNAAAFLAAAAARQFKKEISEGLSPLDWRIMKFAVEAVRGEDAMMTRAATSIAARIDAPSLSAAEWPAEGALGHKQLR